MRRLVTIITGKKLAVEEKIRNDKTNVYLHLICGFDSIRFIVRDQELKSKLEAIPEMERQGDGFMRFYQIIHINIL